METCSLLCLPVGRLQPVVLVEDEAKTPEALMSLLVSRSDAEDICWQPLTLSLHVNCSASWCF